MEASEVRDRMIRGESIPWTDILAWSLSGDIELLGAAFQALTAKEATIDGEVDQQEALALILRYLREVLAGKACATTFQMQPYVAGHSLAGLYRELHSREPKPDQMLADIRSHLATLYRDGGDDERRLVVDGVLEHILEDPTCLGDFADWNDDPVLESAMSQAMEWSGARP